MGGIYGSTQGIYDNSRIQSGPSHTEQLLGSDLQAQIKKLPLGSTLLNTADNILKNQSAFARAGKLLAAGALGVVGTAGIVVNSVNTQTYVGLPIALAGNLILGLSQGKNKTLENLGAGTQVIGMIIALPSVASTACLFLAASLAKNAVESQKHPEKSQKQSIVPELTDWDIYNKL